MAQSSRNTKLPRQKVEGEMKRFAKTENDDIARIPDIVRIRPIAIEPTLAIRVTLNVPNVRIAIGVSYYAPFHLLHHPLNILRVELYTQS